MTSIAAQANPIPPDVIPAGGHSAAAGWLAAESSRSAQTPPPQQDGGPTTPSATEAAVAISRSTIEIYGFAPLKLDTTPRIVTRNGIPLSTTTELNLGEVLERLEWISALRASHERGRLGVLTDLSYARLGDAPARTGPTGILSGRAGITAGQGIYDLALRYRFGDPESALGTAGRFSLIPYAGVRVIDARLDVDAQLTVGNQVFTRQGRFGRTWAQPLAGLQAGVFLSPRLRAFARGDIGGFGLSGAKDLSGNAQLGLGYAIGNNTDLNLSWRYLSIDFQDSSNPDRGFKTTQNGIELGLKFFF